MRSFGKAVWYSLEEGEGGVREGEGAVNEKPAVIKRMKYFC